MATMTVSGVKIFDAAPSLQGLSGATVTTPPTATNTLQLQRLGAFAATNDPATPVAPNAEVVAYDSSTNRLYIQNTNENRIEIAAITTAGAIQKTGEIQLASLAQYGSVNSVAVYNGLVAVAYANVTGNAPGRVVFFDSAGTLLRSVEVGVGPDQIVFTRDGSRLLVANEGEQFSAGSNPVGGVSIIDVSGGGANASVVTTVGFDGLNGSEAALRTQGLAIVPGNAAAADIEPEYITISPDNRFAYVTLQEVNGVAVIDLANPGTAPIAIQPLGAVNRSLAGNEFDASDRDGPPATPGGNGTASIQIATTPTGTPIFGLLQPDAVASFTTGGATYFVTANEGDQRVIGGADDNGDVARLSDVPDNRLTSELQALKTNSAYARLNVLLRVGDTDNDGRIDQLHTLGGRSISIFRQNEDGTITKVRETGGEFEKIFAQIAPARFNNDQVVGNRPDDRSDNKGPEPEGITIGTVNGRVYAFVGLERQSGVIVYDVTDPANASYVSYVPPAPNQTTDLGPEVLTFIAADRNPTGTPLLISANEVANGGAVIYAALPQGFTQEIRFAANSLAVSRPEGDAGNTVFTFTVERNNGTLGAVSFTAELSGSGSNPVNGADFAGNPTLPLIVAGTIPAGVSSAQVNVTVQGDVAFEASETFGLTLRSATSNQAGITAALSTSAGTATGTIVNDDAAPLPPRPPVDPNAPTQIPAAGETVTLTGKITGSLTLDGAGTLILTGTNTYTGPTEVKAGTLLVNGSIVSPTTVKTGGTLGGSGSVGTVAVEAGGALAPGNSPGILSTRDLSLAAGAVLKQEIGGTASGQFDQLKVTGTVALSGANLDVSAFGSFASARGDRFVIIDNDGTDAVSGSFAGLNEGAVLGFGARSLRISYQGGDGNDVTLTDTTGLAFQREAFGAVVTSAESGAGQVYGLYEALLNRAPDALGLSGFTTALENGASLTQVAGAILGSVEHGPAQTATAYVESLYANLLNRPADAAGLQSWTGQLAAGASQASVAAQIASSAEAKAVLAPAFANGVFVFDASEASVARLYYGLLDRAPDAGGLRGFSAFIETSGAGPAGEAARLGQVASTILTSQEYTSGHAGQSDAAFVFDLYQDALGRAPDAGGQAGYLSALANGTSRAQVALDITQSHEAQIHLLGLIQDGTLLVA